MRFAIIGCGEAGSRRAAAIEAVDDTEITVCVDTVLDRAGSLAARSGADVSGDWRTAVSRNDVDAVVIATANNLHAAIGIAAAEAGKHILCERPLARNPAEAAQMVSAARDQGVHLMTGFGIRHHPAVAKVRQLLDTGRIGDITFIRGYTGRGSYAARPAEWMVDCELSGGGTLMDNGSDILDLCRYLMGDFSRVSGHAATLLWPIEPCEDNAFAILTTHDGRAAMVHSSWTDWQGYLSLDISGADGYIRLDYDEGVVAVGFRPGAPGAGLEESFDLSGLPDRSRVIEIEEFMAAIRENKGALTGGIDGLENVILAHAIYRSSEEGRSISL
jgi:predicted dehydrogenase